MAYYIDRDALFSYLIKSTGFRTNCEGCTDIDCLDCIANEGIKRFPTIVRKIPPADVDMVRHGRWEWFEEWDPGTTDHPRECQDSGWRCDECKTALEDVVGGCWDDPDDEQKLKFCPNCGCCMDGGDPA